MSHSQVTFFPFAGEGRHGGSFSKARSQQRSFVPLYLRDMRILGMVRLRNLAMMRNITSWLRCGWPVVQSERVARYSFGIGARGEAYARARICSLEARTAD